MVILLEGGGGSVLVASLQLMQMDIVTGNIRNHIINPQL
jgi:hypothetical protein